MPESPESAIYNRLTTAPLFHPASADLFMRDWTLEPGDVVTVKDGNTDYRVPVYSMNLEWNGNSRVEIESTGHEKREPLPALRRKQYGGNARAYRQGMVDYDKIKEFETRIDQTDEEIQLRAYQRDMDNVESILRQAGISLNAQGVLVYADDDANMLQAKLNVQAGNIALVVNGTGANASIRAASIIAAINGDESTITISANKIDLDGYVMADALSALSAEITNLETGATTATTLRANALYGDTLNTHGLWIHDGEGYVNATWKSKTVISSIATWPTGTVDWMYQNSNGSIQKASGKIITSVNSTTIYYLGR